MSPSYKNFQTNERKYSDSDDIFKRPKSMVKEESYSFDRQENIIDWATYYRRNVHRFVQHYFGISLYPYQVIWLYAMSLADSYVAICSRAVGKTWLLAVLACARAVLYPNSEIVVVSSTKEQAGIIVSDKIEGLANNHPNLAREISKITTNMNKWAVDFHNGSVIKVVASRDSSRGKRSTFTIYEEFRLIDKTVLDAVIRPFSYIRQAPYLKNKKYSHLVEEPKEVFISSAYHKGLWWYNETRKNIVQMSKGLNAGFIAIDLAVAIRHNIKTIKQVRNEVSKMDEITALEEYWNIPWGENSDAYFKLKMFTRARKLTKAFYPQRPQTYNSRKNPYDIRKHEGELRILSCDIAQRAGRANDLSITSCIRLEPTAKGYLRELVYMESYSGIDSISQGIRIKQIFNDFDADAIVLDVATGGIGIYDQLGLITKDDERGIEYPAMTIMRHSFFTDVIYNELKDRTTSLNAIPVIFPITTGAKLNSEIAVEMRDKLQKRMWSFLVDDKTAEEYLLQSEFKKEILSQEDLGAKSWFLSPFVQTSLMINEFIGLSMRLVAGNIKLEERSGSRKDRYTSISYGNYYISLLDLELIKERDHSDEWDVLKSMTFVA